MKKQKRLLLTLSDFIKVELTDAIFYYSLDTGEYEITLEPHLTAGFTVAIYDIRDPFLSIRKRAVWKFNHPTNPPCEKVGHELLDQALALAQYFYDYYHLRDRLAVLPDVRRIV